MEFLIGGLPSGEEGSPPRAPPRIALAAGWVSFTLAILERMWVNIQSALTWHNPPDKQGCRIYFRRTGDISDRSKWPEYQEWLRTKLEALYRAFSPRLKALSPAATNGQVSADDEGQ